MLLIKISGDMSHPRECTIDCKGNTAVRIGLLLEEGKWKVEKKFKNINGDDALKCSGEGPAATAAYLEERLGVQLREVNGVFILALPSWLN